VLLVGALISRMGRGATDARFQEALFLHPSLTASLSAPRVPQDTAYSSFRTTPAWRNGSNDIGGYRLAATDQARVPPWGWLQDM